MISIKIEGATCQGCVNAIEKALGNTQGVNSASFDLNTQWASIDATTDMDALTSAIEDAGFDVLESKED